MDTKSRGLRSRGGTDKYLTEIVPTYWEDAVIPEKWRQTKQYIRDHKHPPLIAGLDIETSTAPDQSCAWMYLWCMAINDFIVYGRTLRDLKCWINRLINALDLRVDYKLLCYIHNAKYDLSFLRKMVSLAGRKPEEFIARTQRQIIKCCMDYCIEIRDSAVYSEMPLEMMGIDINLPKLSEDHDLIRTPETPLTDDDLRYCARDAHILTVYYREQSRSYGGMTNLDDLPLTATARVRKKLDYCFRSQRGLTDYVALTRYIASKQLHTKHTGSNPPTEEQLQKYERDRAVMAMLRSAFFGGYCFASPSHAGNIYKDICVSADIDAAYAWAMLTQRFPLDRFKPLPIPETEDEEYQMRMGVGEWENYALLIHIKIYKLQAFEDELGFIPSGLKYTLQYDTLRRNKSGQRVKSAEVLELCLTDVDYRNLHTFYDYEEIEIIDVIGSRYGNLPPYITDTILMLYSDKAAAKKEIKRKRREHTATLQDEIRYQAKKTMLARLYGVFVQDPIRMHWEFNSETHRVEAKGLEQADTAQYGRVLYQWGVWVAAWARDRLLSAMLDLGAPPDKDGYPVWDGSVLYADTDCVRFLLHGEDDPRIEMLYKQNEEMQIEMRRIVTTRKPAFKLLYGIDIPDDLLDRCGSWDIDRYAIYKHIGIKQYCTVDYDGTFKATIAGLPKADYREDEDGSTVNVGMSYFDRFETIEDKVDALQIGMLIPEDESCILRSAYFDEVHELDVVDCTGVQRHVVTDCGLVLQPTPYKNSKSDVELLTGILEGDLTIESAKLGVDLYKIAKERGMHREDTSELTEQIRGSSCDPEVMMILKNLR